MPQQSKGRKCTAQEITGLWKVYRDAIFESVERAFIEQYNRVIIHMVDELQREEEDILPQIKRVDLLDMDNVTQKFIFFMKENFGAIVREFDSGETVIKSSIADQIVVLSRSSLSAQMKKMYDTGKCDDWFQKVYNIYMFDFRQKDGQRSLKRYRKGGMFWLHTTIPSYSMSIRFAKNHTIMQRINQFEGYIRREVFDIRHTWPPKYNVELPEQSLEIMKSGANPQGRLLFEKQILELMVAKWKIYFSLQGGSENYRDEEVKNSYSEFMFIFAFFELMEDYYMNHQEYETSIYFESSEREKLAETYEKLQMCGITQECIAAIIQSRHHIYYNQLDNFGDSKYISNEEKDIFIGKFAWLRDHDNYFMGSYLLSRGDYYKGRFWKKMMEMQGKSIDAKLEIAKKMSKNVMDLF